MDVICPRNRRIFIQKKNNQRKKKWNRNCFPISSNAKAMVKPIFLFCGLKKLFCTIFACKSLFVSLVRFPVGFVLSFRIFCDNFCGIFWHFGWDLNNWRLCGCIAVTFGSLGEQVSQLEGHKAVELANGCEKRGSCFEFFWIFFEFLWIERRRFWVFLLQRRTVDFARSVCWCAARSAWKRKCKKISFKFRRNSGLFSKTLRLKMRLCCGTRVMKIVLK